MQRFYFRDLTLTPDLVIRDEAFVHQIGRVLRSTVGDTVILFSGDGDEHIYEIRSVTKKDVTLTRLRTERNMLDPTRRICLYQAIPNKYEKIEWIIEKWVEVGISAFVFFPSDRSQKLAITEKKLARWHEIAREALEQSGGNRFPEIVFREERGIPTYTETWAIVLHTSTVGSGSAREIENSDKSLVIYVGPEGGWSDTEIDIFSKRGISTVHFEGRIMRTETAGPVIAFSCLHP